MGQVSNIDHPFEGRKRILVLLSLGNGGTLAGLAFLIGGNDASSVTLGCSCRDRSCRRGTLLGEHWDQPGGLSVSKLFAAGQAASGISASGVVASTGLLMMRRDMAGLGWTLLDQ
jgi:hypothetical protein